MRIECMTSTGGTSLRDDILRLKRRVHIIVATPGRILDLAYKKVCRLDRCRHFVLDEADKLISREFQPIILKIMNFLHPQKQVLLFSATYPQSVSNFIEKFPHM